MLTYGLQVEWQSAPSTIILEHNKMVSILLHVHSMISLLHTCQFQINDQDQKLSPVYVPQYICKYTYIIQQLTLNCSVDAMVNINSIFVNTTVSSMFT